MRKIVSSSDLLRPIICETVVCNGYTVVLEDIQDGCTHEHLVHIDNYGHLTHFFQCWDCDATGALDEEPSCYRDECWCKGDFSIDDFSTHPRRLH